MNKRTLILAVDDEPSLLRLLKIDLSAEGYEVVTASDASAALEAVDRRRPDLALLDIMMPGVDGMQLLATLRSTTNMPVIMLTAMDSDQDKIRGLVAGADDYIAKPFNPDELIARIDAVLRRRDGASAKRSIVEAGALRIDLERRTVMRNGDPVELTRTEWRLLQHFASNPGKVLLASELLTKVWGPEYIDDMQYLRLWVSRLRHKIEADPGSPVLLINRPGIGYVFAPDGSCASS